MTTKPTPKKLTKAAALIAASVDYKKYARSEKYACEPLRIAERLAEFCKATAEGRMFCIIHSVSSSGMTRNMSFCETAKLQTPHNEKKYCQLNFWSLFKALGYREAKGDGFAIGGCGMDMVFATHYNIIHSAARFGLITKKQCAKLSQMTPPHF
jgi:hypothetical protein